ncbi:MAG: 50S ribosomal protein L2 [Nitrospirota bacterium]|nr:50S ribosomal protein L2 [Nitrospirota bacterium]
MPIRPYKPTSPGRRNMSVSGFDEITQGNEPHKALVEKKTRISGRNNNGRITMRRRGGGHKRKLRIIDFRRNKPGVPGRVEAIEYDPNRSARIALICYADGERRYILHPLGVKVGDSVVADERVEVHPGNAMPLAGIPLGTAVHNVELQPGGGGKIARSAGSSVQLMAKEGVYALLRLRSGEVRKVRIECMATIGQVGNTDHDSVSIGKAGRSRWKGRRPKVRGVAMNPVDHPLGGGEGKTAGGRHPVSPWGTPAKGYRTRNNPRTDRLIVSRRRK